MPRTTVSVHFLSLRFLCVAATHLWPLRRPFASDLVHVANLGLGLRWSAALAEIAAYEAIPAAWRAAMLRIRPYR